MYIKPSILPTPFFALSYFLQTFYYLSVVCNNFCRLFLGHVVGFLYIYSLLYNFYLAAFLKTPMSSYSFPAFYHKNLGFVIVYLSLSVH
jgi:hypothetical protein